MIFVKGILSVHSKDSCVRVIHVHEILGGHISKDLEKRRTTSHGRYCPGRGEQSTFKFSFKNKEKLEGHLRKQVYDTELHSEMSLVLLFFLNKKVRFLD